MSYLHFIAPPLPHFIVSGEDTYVPGQIHIERTNIGVFDMLVVTKGCLSIKENGQNWDVHAGESLILRPDLHHGSGGACSEVTHFYWIHFQTTGYWVETTSGLSPIPQRLAAGGLLAGAEYSVSEDKDTGDGIQEDDGSYIDIKTFYLTIPKFHRLSDLVSTYEHLKELLQLEKRAQPSARWQQQRLFHAVLQVLTTQSNSSRLSSGTIRLAEEVASFIRQNYNSKLSLEIIGKSMNFHPVYISRCMREGYGCSAIEYLTRYRLDRAKTLLMNTNQSIEHIAEQVGFNRVTYFSRCFSKAEGITPRDFRNQYRTAK